MTRTTRTTRTALVSPGRRSVGPEQVAVALRQHDGLGVALVVIAAHTDSSEHGHENGRPTQPRTSRANDVAQWTRTAPVHNKRTTTMVTDNDGYRRRWDETMRAVRIHQTGGTDVMVIEDVSEPRPGPGEVLVRLAAAGVNFVDTYHRSGLYPMPLPMTLGSEGAGEVVAVGDGVDAISVGQRVGSTNFAGAYAEFAIAAADRVVALPADVDDDLAA